MTLKNNTIDMIKKMWTPQGGWTFNLKCRWEITH